MLSRCALLAVLGCVLAAPRPQYQPQPAESIPPHLLREYLGQQNQAPAQTQVIPRAVHPTPIPAARPQYAVQPEQYQQQAQPQYQAQTQYQAQPAYQAQPQYRAQPQPQAQPQYQQQQQRPQEQRERPEDYEANPSYQFGFDVNDDQFTNYQNRKEQRDGDVIKGSYSVVDSDGFIRTVTYTADPKEGFRAEVQRTPTDIVVKIPTPKPQALQQQAIQPQIAHAQPRPQPQAQPQQYYRYEQ